MDIKEPIYYEDVIKAIEDFKNQDVEIVNKLINVVIPYYTLDHITTELSQAKDKAFKLQARADKLTTELEKKEKELEEAKRETQQVLDDYQDLGKEKYKLESELENKEKIIELMAKYMAEEFAEYQLDYIYQKVHNAQTGMERNWTRGIEEEIKDIKEFFNKVEKEGK